MACARKFKQACVSLPGGMTIGNIDMEHSLGREDVRNGQRKAVRPVALLNGPMVATQMSL
eukprot:scaffold8624_cov46-Prasinocladus_malaysianus.AAC.2